MFSLCKMDDHEDRQAAPPRRREDDRSYERPRSRDGDRRSDYRNAPRDRRYDRPRSRDKRRYERSRSDDRQRRPSRYRYARSRSRRDSRRGDDYNRRREDRDRPRRYERRSQSRGDDRRDNRRRSRSRSEARRYGSRSRSRDGLRRGPPPALAGDRRYGRPAPAAPARPKSEIEVYLASLGMDNPALPSYIASMDDELARDFIEKLMLLSKFPKPTIRDLLNTVIRKRASIKNPSAWLMVSMKKEKPCFIYTSTGMCQHGDKCRYKHMDPP